MEWFIWVILGLIVVYYTLSFVLKILDRNRLKKLSPLVRQVVEKIESNCVQKCILVDDKGECVEVFFKDEKGKPNKKAMTE